MGKRGTWASLAVAIIGVLIALLSWRYPINSSPSGPSTSVPSGGPSTSSAAGTITALRSINVDFSVPSKDLEEWLGNEFTSYPAIASELLALVKGRKLSGLVSIDVIVSNYSERTPGVNSPRTASDVRVNLLKAAVLEGYNKRYGTSESSFDAIVRY